MLPILEQTTAPSKEGKFFNVTILMISRYTVAVIRIVILHFQVGTDTNLVPILMKVELVNNFLHWFSKWFHCALKLPGADLHT